MTKKKTGGASQPEEDTPIAIPEAHDLVSRATIIAKIADRVQRPDDTVREARDKVGKRLAYAIKKGYLARPVQGTFVFGDVVRWARTVPGWCEKLDGLPQTDPPKAPPVHVRADHAAAYDLSSKECHELLAAVTAELQAALDELVRVRPLAKKWEHFMATRYKGQKKSSGSK